MKDQGWGNPKGGIGIAIIQFDERLKERKVEMIHDCFGVAKHNWKQHNVVLTPASAPILFLRM